MTPAPHSALNWEGLTMLDRAGEKIGTIEEIYLVEETGRPEWALVKIGRLRAHTTLVPLSSAQAVEDGVKVSYKKDVVSDAPSIDAGEEPSEQQANAFYRHYGIDFAAEQAAARNTDGAGAALQYAPQVSNGSSSGHGDMRDEPVSDLVKQVSDEAKKLISQEIKLAKAEMTEKAKEVGIGAGMFGGAGYLAHLAALALMLCLIFALATFISAWLAALIVTFVFAAGAGTLALMGKRRIKKAGPPVPEETVQSVKQTIETVKEEAKWGLGQTR
ncbi:MAG TPA: phage holin family protein [Solirubrobacteraceae bacterium]|jgi:sporulation protein YlmC with PRC-barrel domain